MIDPMIALLRRSERETTFDSTCRITAPGGGSLDADGVWQGSATTVYTGPCAFLPTEAMVRTVAFAGSRVELYPYTVKVPAATPVEEDHVVEITACPDAEALGFYTVRSVVRSQWQVSRVLGCEQGVSNG